MERRRRWRKRDPKNWLGSEQPRHQPNCNMPCLVRPTGRCDWTRPGKKRRSSVEWEDVVCRLVYCSTEESIRRQKSRDSRKPISISSLCSGNALWRFAAGTMPVLLARSQCSLSRFFKCSFTLSWSAIPIEGYHCHCIAHVCVYCDLLRIQLECPQVYSFFSLSCTPQSKHNFNHSTCMLRLHTIIQPTCVFHLPMGSCLQRCSH